MGQEAGRTGCADGLTMKNQKNKNWLMAGCQGYRAETGLGHDEK
jgi:hypothetical protein